MKSEIRIIYNDDTTEKIVTKYYEIKDTYFLYETKEDDKIIRTIIPYVNIFLINIKDDI